MAESGVSGESLIDFVLTIFMCGPGDAGIMFYVNVQIHQLLFILSGKAWKYFIEDRNRRFLAADEALSVSSSEGLPYLII